MHIHQINNNKSPLFSRGLFCYHRFMNQRNVTTLFIVCLSLGLMSVIEFSILQSQSPFQLQPFQQINIDAPNTQQNIYITQSISQENPTAEIALAQKIAEECAPEITQQARKNCYESKILTAINQDPTKTNKIFTDIWDLAVKQKITDDPRIFLDPAHEAGMMLASKKIPLEEAFAFCGTTFKQGCMHGYIMEYIDDTYTKEADLKSFKAVCENIKDPLSKINCIHGLGHELTAKIKKDLPEVLVSCKDIAENPSELSACQSGISMEYTKGKPSTGNHSHNAVGLVRLPCTTLPDEYKKTCIASEGAYRQYNPSHEDFKTTYNFCLSNDAEYIPSCMLAVSERAVIATAENAEKEIALCNQLKNEHRPLCIDSLIQVSITQFNNKNLTAKLQEYQSGISN